MVILSRNIHIFIKVAETGNTTEAAKALFISQPAVSKAISMLEEELKTRLFIRDKKNGLILTEAGSDILKTARQMVALENRMYQTSAQENAYLSGTVRIATRPILTSAILSKVLGDFRRSYPHIKVEIIEGDTIELNRMIEEHQVDFGITFSPFGSLQHRVLTKDRMVAISNTPFPQDSPTDIKKDPQNFILCQSGVETLRANIGSKCPTFSPSTVVKQPETVVKLAEGGCGIGILSELAYQLTRTRLHVNPIQPSVALEVAITAVNFEELSPAAGLMVDIISQVT